MYHVSIIFMQIHFFYVKEPLSIQLSIVGSIGGFKVIEGVVNIHPYNKILNEPTSELRKSKVIDILLF